MKPPPKKDGAPLGAPPLGAPPPGATPKPAPAPAAAKPATGAAPKPATGAAPKPATGAAPKPTTGAAPKPAGQVPVMVSSGGKVTLSAGKPAAKNEYLAQMKAGMKDLHSGHSHPGSQVPTGGDQIEELVFAIPGISTPDAPQMFRNFAERILPRVRLPDTSLAILQSFANIDVTAERMAVCLRRNPYYEEAFYRVIETVSHRQEKPVLDAALVLLGMQNSRNLILSMQAVRTVTGRYPEWGKDGKLKLAPKESLKFALRIEEALASNKDGYADTGYAAGMVFDLLALISEELAQDKKALSQYIDQTFAHSLKTAQIGAALGKLIPDFVYGKYAFSACLLHDVGKIAMAILDPTYFRFIEDCTKKPTPRAVRSFAERRRFGVDHAMLGSLICSEFGIFGPIEKAILFHHDPFTARTRKGIYDLTALICMSTNVATNYKKVEKDDDPVLALWKGTELKDFRLDIRTVRATVSRLALA